MTAYSQLQNQALDALEYRSIAGLLRRQVNILLFIAINGFPFSNPTSFAVVRRRSRKDNDHFVVRACWRSDLDTPKSPLDEVKLAVQSPDPTIEMQVAECDDAWAGKALQPFANTSIPLTPKHSIGIDGVTYEIVIGDLFCGLNLRWWSNGPAEWKPVVEHVMGLIKEIESDKFKFEDGPLAFSYSVELIWKPPGVQACHLHGIRELIPSMAARPVTGLLQEIRGTTALHVGVYSKNDAIIKCNMAAEFGLVAVMKRSKGD